MLLDCWFLVAKRMFKSPNDGFNMSLTLNLSKSVE